MAPRSVEAMYAWWGCHCWMQAGGRHDERGEGTKGRRLSPPWDTPLSPKHTLLLQLFYLSGIQHGKYLKREVCTYWHSAPSVNILLLCIHSRPSWCPYMPAWASTCVSKRGTPRHCARDLASCLLPCPL
jgi:hypothetical protein